VGALSEAPLEIWTLSALKQYVDQRFDAAQVAVDKAVGTTSLAVDKAFIENQRAIDKAEEALSKRLEGMNEIREQLNAQAATFATTPVVEALKTTMALMTTELAEFKAVVNGQITSLSAAQGELAGQIKTLLDPRAGIYSTQDQAVNRLQRQQGTDTDRLKTWALALLTTLVVALIVYALNH
jgi:predicted RNA binding protein with dsRBD fold (UPF0201 family)